MFCIKERRESENKRLFFKKRTGGQESQYIREVELKVFSPFLYAFGSKGGSDGSALLSFHPIQLRYLAAGIFALIRVLIEKQG